MLEFILVNLCVCIALAEIHLTFYFQKWVVCHFDPNFGSPFKFSVPKRKRKRKRNSLSRVPKKERCLFIGFQANAQMSVRIQFISTIPLRFTSISNLPSSPFSTSRLWFSGCRNVIGMEEKGFLETSEAVVADSDLLKKKLDAMRFSGPQKLQVIADFDATLTRYWIDGRRGQTSHGLLKQGNPEYDTKRDELYKYYHPLEYSPTISIEEKTKLMEEWWGKSHSLLIEGGLTFDAIKQSVATASIAFREGVVELFELLEERDVPVLIFSAGLADIIEEVLRQKLHRSFKNIRIVSNRMVFDDNGCLVSFKGKTIHSLNKNEHALDMAAPLHDQLGDVDGAIDDSASVRKRTNVLLLGDHIGDLGMSDGLNYDTRISVGFLNDNIENSLDSYRNAFDIVYLNDASMLGVVKLVHQLFPV